MSKRNRRQHRTGPSAAQDVVPVLVVVALAVIATGRLCAYEFTNWDDPDTVATNPAFNPPSLAGVASHWRRPHMDLYIPVTYTLWGVVASGAYDERTGLDSRPFHTVNVLLHALNSAVVFLLIRRLLANPHARPAALAAACLFAVHPVQVEPVAWVSGLKDVLCGTLTLLALLGYVTFARAGNAETGKALGWRYYVLATLAYALAMLAKPTAVVTPVMAALIDRFILKRSVSAVAWAVLPWALLAVPMVVVTKVVQPAEHVGSAPPLWLRPLVATDAMAFYVGKLLFPWKLTIDYGRTPELAIARGWVHFTWIVPLAIAVTLWLLRRRVPAAGVGASLAVVGLLPVLGLVRFDFQEFSTVADHYLYLPMLGVSMILAGILSQFPPKRWRYMMAIVVAALTIRSIAQAAHWRDSLALAEHSVSINPYSRTGNNNLAAALMERGEHTRALPAAKQAVTLNPTDARARATLAAALAASGKFADAESEYRRSIDLDPRDAHPIAALASLLAAQQRAGEAIAMGERLVSLDPASPDAHYFLAMLQARFARTTEAKHHLHEALRLKPDFLPARQGLDELNKLPVPQ